MQQPLEGNRFYHHKGQVKQHLKKLLPILAILGYIFYLLLGPYGFVNICRLKREELTLRRQREAFVEERAALTDSLLMIKRDTFLLEKLAREKLGMIMPGDTVILTPQE